MTEPTAAPPPSEKSYPQWRNHALLVASFAALGAIVVFLSYRLFPPSGRSGDIIQSILIDTLVLQAIVSTVLLAILRGFGSRGRKALIAAHVCGALVGYSPLILMEAGGIIDAVAGHSGKTRNDAICKGVVIEQWRFVSSKEPGGPALELQLSSPASVSGPLYLQFLYLKDAPGNSVAAMSGSLPAGFSGTVPTGKRLTITAPLTPVNQPVAFVEFSLCWKDGDPDTCLVYSYGENTHPNDGSATQCAQLPKPSGVWPPPL